MLPPLNKGTPDEITKLSDLRKLNKESLVLATEQGFLWFAEMMDGGEMVPVWLLTDARKVTALIRRLDGLLFKNNSKAKMVSGSTIHWPMGIEESRNCRCIALVEGGPDFLAALAFIINEEKTAEVAPVCMPSANSHIPPEALPLFKGKLVRIFPHCDPSGRNAAVAWETQLANVAANVHCYDLSEFKKRNGDPVKDLNDLTQQDADNWEDNRDAENLMDWGAN